MSYLLCGQCFERQVKSAVCGSCGAKSRASGGSNVLPVGSVLDGKFIVGNLLGEPGGFGIAYLCFDRTLQRKVVVKELFPEGLVTRQPGGTEVRVLMERHRKSFNLQRQLFLEEARKLALFDGVVGVVRVIQHFSENETAYFVMPYIAGHSLAHLIAKNGPLSAAQLLTWFWPLAEGLAAVHRLDILHSDIKPENILIDERGQPVLIDFGNATASDPSKTSATDFHAWSPHFSAPEQQSNNRDLIGPWTDVYALCGLLYFCLSGQRPVDATQRSAEVRALVPLRELAPQAPELLIQVIEQGLALRESARPPDVDGLVKALAPLRPAVFHWLHILPDNAFGIRMRRIYSKVEAGAAKPHQFNPFAGIFQWFWLYSQQLTEIASVLSILLIGLFGLGIWFHWAFIAFIFGLFLAGGFCAFYGDYLLYNRIATLGSSLLGNTLEQRNHSQELLTKAGTPDPKRMLIGLIVPLSLIFIGFALESYEASVRERVERALALTGLRESISSYIRENQVPPMSFDDMNYMFTPDKEIKASYMAAGNIHLTLAVPAVEGQQVTLRRHDENGQVIWLCEAIGMPAVFTPASCKK